MTTFLLVVMLAGLLAGCGQTQQDATCPTILNEATRLIVVATKDFDSSSAQLTTFERGSISQSWHRGPIHENAVVGRNGLGWGFTFRDVAQGDEPLKQEGDKRAPAGIFKLGASFGLGEDLGSNIISLRPGEHVCVDDVGSEHYNQIVPRTMAGAPTSGEEMWTINLYRRGLIIDYPSDRKAAAGSCIFIHIWKGPDVSTAGCVALAETTVQSLQKWAAGQEAAIAILPQQAVMRFSRCLPDR